MKVLFYFDKIEIPTKLYCSLKFRWFNFQKFRFRWNRNFDFGFDCLLSTKSKFLWNFILISSKFWCWNRNFDFDVEIRISLPIPTPEFPLWFLIRNQNFDSDIGIPISVLDFNVEISKHFSILPRGSNVTGTTYKTDCGLNPLISLR
jgi:hypothetical protein